MGHLSYYIVMILGVLIGLAVGLYLGVNRMHKAVKDSSVGDLRIDRSIPDDPPRPCLEIYAGNTIDSISQKKFVILKVINKNYLPRD